MTPVVQDRLKALDTMTLKRGAHDSVDAGVCAMELVAYIAGEPHTDHPACTSPVLAAFTRQWNDDLDDEGRQMLKPLLPRMVGTAGDGFDEQRGWMCADWLIRVYTPTWLELAGVTESAAALRALAPIAGAATVAAARPTINEARKKGAAAWAAAWAAAGDAAWDAAGAAARAAAGAAAGDAAGAAARAAAGDAARDAAWAAAWAATGAAAWDATWAAAWDATRAAAWAALEPTKVGLQASALDLLDRMITLGDTERAA
jgi:hypothetical protein